MKKAAPIEIMKKYGVQHESWGPFAENMFINPVIKAIGDKYARQIKEDFAMNNERNELFKTGAPLPEMFSKYFIGQAYLQPLTKKGGPIANVTFEPGCRNNWHIHHKGGQILLCTEGRGWYQAWGEAPMELHPGDVVNIPPEVKHWHGASKDSWFAHLAVEVPADGASNEWLEPVDDEAYGKLK